MPTRTGQRLNSIGVGRFFAGWQRGTLFAQRAWKGFHQLVIHNICTPIFFYLAVLIWNVDDIEESSFLPITEENNQSFFHDFTSILSTNHIINTRTADKIKRFILICANKRDQEIANKEIECHCQQLVDWSLTSEYI